MNQRATFMLPNTLRDRAPRSEATMEPNSVAVWRPCEVLSLPLAICVNQRLL